MTQGNVLPTKILVKKFIKPDKVTPSGLLIPNTIIKEENSIVGDVTLVGEGTVAVPIPVKVGQRVIFNKHAALSLSIKEEQFLLIDVRDVLFYYNVDE